MTTSPVMIVLFTDFGPAGPYQGQVTAVLRRQVPDADVINLFADAPRGDPMSAAYLLAAYTNEFPAGTVFLCVVDPGVGSDRRAVIVEAGGRWFVGPDNGLFEIVLRRAPGTARWWEIADVSQEASATFHGRDVFAPAAAAVARGELPVGEGQSVAGIRRPGWPDDLARIVYIDGFGNAMTGVRAATVPPGTRVRVGGEELTGARTFSDVARGVAFWYANANGLLEIAVNDGRADTRFALKIGSPVEKL